MEYALPMMVILGATFAVALSSAAHRTRREVLDFQDAAREQKMDALITDIRRVVKEARE